MKFKIIINLDGTINGENAVQIYTTYGIDPERLEKLSGLKINKEQYNKAFEEHKIISAKSCLKKFGHKSWRHPEK